MGNMEEGIFLDVGCGTGNMLAGKSNIIGIDISKSMLKFAQNTNPDSRFVVGDLNEKLPFKDKVFDGFYSNNVFAYLRNPEATLKELYRILKPESKLVIATLRPSFNPLAILWDHVRKTSVFFLFRYLFLVFVVLILNLQIVLRIKKKIYHGYEISDLRKLINESGFETISGELSYVNQDVLLVAKKPKKC